MVMCYSGPRKLLIQMVQVSFKAPRKAPTLGWKEGFFPLPASEQIPSPLQL
jgi:hypothetical protein